MLDRNARVIKALETASGGIGTPEGETALRMAVAERERAGYPTWEQFFLPEEKERDYMASLMKDLKGKVKSVDKQSTGGISWSGEGGRIRLCYCILKYYGYEWFDKKDLWQYADECCPDTTKPSAKQSLMERITRPGQGLVDHGLAEQNANGLFRLTDRVKTLPPI